MVFVNRPLQKKSIFQMIFRQEPEENSIIELNNYLAARELKSVTLDDVRRIESKYKVSLKKEFRLNIEEFYLVYLNEYLGDNFKLTDSQQNELIHLKNIFGLDTAEIALLHELLGTSIYGRHFERHLRKDRHDTQVDAKLRLLVETLNMNNSVVERIRLEKFTSITNELITKIVNKNRFSIEDEKKINNMAISVNIPLKIDKDTDKKLKKARQLWELENLDLPIIQVNTALQKNETCYFYSNNVNWYEYRSERGVRIPKFLYSGSILLTNKRLIFESSEKNTTIKLSVIAGAFLHENCLEIRKEAGRSPLLEVKDLEDLSIIVKRLLFERH